MPGKHKEFDMNMNEYGEWLDGPFLLRVLDVRNSGRPDAGDGTKGTDRYCAKVIKAPAGSSVGYGDDVSVKFANNGRPPTENPHHRFYGEIGAFDGRDNDIQSHPGKIKTNRPGATWKNPFEKKYRAIDCNGRLVNPEDVGKGIYFCLKCLKIVFWREIAGVPQFYHWRYNPNCPWSESGGPWGDAEDSNDLIDYQKRWHQFIDDLARNRLLHLLEGQDPRLIGTPVDEYLLKGNPDEETASILRNIIEPPVDEYLFEENPDEETDSALGKIGEHIHPDLLSPPSPPPPKPSPPLIDSEEQALEVVEDKTGRYGLPGLALKAVPVEFRTRRVCELAVRLNTRALQFVPEALLDEAMYKTSRQYQYDTHFIQ